MDSLDHPDLELFILKSLAENLSGEDDGLKPEYNEHLTSGLPETGGAAREEEEDETEAWDESQINYAISYSHYIQALPSTSPKLLEGFEVIAGLLRGLKSGFGGNDAEGSGSRGKTINVHTIETLGLSLLKAVAHIGTHPEGAEDKAIKLLCEFVEIIENGLRSTEKDELALSIVLLSTYHQFILSQPLTLLPTSLISLLQSTHSLSSNSTLQPLDSSILSSNTGSPASTSDKDGDIRVVDESGRSVYGHGHGHGHTHARGGAGGYGMGIGGGGESPRELIRRFSGMRLVLMVLDIEGVLISQALVDGNATSEKDQADNQTIKNYQPHPHHDGDEHSPFSNQASDKPWTYLTNHPIPDSNPSTITYLSDYSTSSSEILQEIASSATRWWDEIMQGEGIGIGSGFEGRRMGGAGGGRGGQGDDAESAVMIAILKLATLTDLHARQVDETNLARLKLLLSDKAPSQHAGTLEMALACVGILVLNYPYLGPSMTQHIRRFATSPLAVFEAEMAGTGLDVPEVMIATARCLAICVQTAPNDDLLSSTLYSLMHTVQHANSIDAPGARSIRSAAVTFAGLGEKDHALYKGKVAEQRRMAGISTIGMVTRLALEIGRVETYQVVITMLLQRLRGADAVTEASIVTHLVPLALKAPDAALLEVVKAFSAISKAGNPEDPRYSSNAVLAAQTTLARGIGNRSQPICRAFLEELLSLFIDKGSQIQTSSSLTGSRESEKDMSSRVSDMTSQLAALLLPIDAVLANHNCAVQENPSIELVANFRNMWFLCTLLGLTSANSPYMNETAKAALIRIAAKTPVLVLEQEKDYVSSALEYNSVFRRDFAKTVVSRQQGQLTEVLPKRSSEIRSLTLPQVVFLQTVHDLEYLRIQGDRPSVLLGYFNNASVNESSIISCLDSIADKLIRVYLSRLSAQVLDHSMPSQAVSDELKRMLIASTHRFRKVREVAMKYLNAILTSFAALMCDRRIVFVLLEILTLLRRSCEDTLTDEYSTTHRYSSDKMDLHIELTDDVVARQEITKQMYDYAVRWLELAIGRAPIEMQTILQRYLKESRDTLLLDTVEMGAGLAMRFAKAISRLDRQETVMPNIGGWVSDSANLLASQFAARNYYSGELAGARFILNNGLQNLEQSAPTYSSTEELSAFRAQMAAAVRNAQVKGSSLPVPELRRLLLRAVSVLTASATLDRDILHYLVALPIRSFTAIGIAAGVDAWSWLVSERPDVEVALISEISDGWLWTIRNRKGLFSDALNSIGPFERPVEYSPSDKSTMDHEMTAIRRALQPHLLLTSVISSRFQAVKYREPGIMGAILRLLARSFSEHKLLSTHPLAREVRFSLILFALQVLASSKLETLLEVKFRDWIYLAAISWFSVRPMWSFGSNKVQLEAEMRLLEDVLAAVQNDHVRGDHAISALSDRTPAFPLPGYSSLRDYALQHAERSRLLQLLIENEITRLTVWSAPSGQTSRSQANKGGLEASISADQWPALIRRAWRMSPAAAVHMAERFKFPPVQAEVSRLVKLQPRAVLDVPEALHFLLGEQLDSSALPALKWLTIWAAVPPVTAVTYFQPRYRNHPLVLQYAMRALEQYPVELTFFFVPQVVQALRSDGAGYVERFIFETSKISQLFCHQIIWNMKANCFKDDAGEIPDPMKPTLDRMVDNVVAALSGKAKSFYDLEFDFFNEVTSISGKLKPYIKKTKPEKKAKIDEEMAKIKVSVGVYLPSNPDGIVVDLDRKSGRPLQSHAKAPFMATFKVQKERTEYGNADSTEATTGNEADSETVRKVKYNVWQAAIFKVGDDCRQDVLALQIIAMFKNVFMKAGLVLYLFPYRVTATAPGCGVIDVVPNATSRDEMGRAKINDLYSYFVDKYGGVDTISFQKARLNFIQSMAAYSVACYILQIKDRHNGNIMIDGEGHIVHIGGVKFEPNSFKLNHEMVALMGGRDSQGFRMFTELTIKAFLAIRPYADQLVDTVHLMLGTGLPSFKGEPTIKRLRDRFQLQLSERQAADYMNGVIKNAYENYRSVVYDEFQRLQNGIPY